MSSELRVRIPAGFSFVNLVCWLLFGVCPTPVLPQWHVKDTAHSANSAGGRFHQTRMHSWPNEVGVGWLCRYSGIAWEPIQKRAHTQLVWEHSATFVSVRCATATDPGKKSGISVREIISNSKKKQKKTSGGEWMVEHSPKIPASEQPLSQLFDQSVHESITNHLSIKSCIRCLCSTSRSFYQWPNQ